MSRDAGGLHCPNCGSPAEAADTRCGYCKAELATVSCPSCFALLFKGAAYCPHCGARAARSLGAEGERKCPGCGKPMREVQLGERTLLECGGCAGLWVDADTFEHICADGEARAAVLSRWSPAKTATETRVRYRPCAVCERMMNRLNFGRLSGTVIDVCKGHGTFLDAGELHRIATFIQDGGLERARQRQMDDLKEAEARALAAQRDQAMRAARTGEGQGVRFEWRTSRLEGADALDVLRRLLREDRS